MHFIFFHWHRSSGLFTYTGYSLHKQKKDTTHQPAGQFLQSYIHKVERPKPSTNPPQMNSYENSVSQLHITFISPSRAACARKQWCLGKNKTISFESWRNKLTYCLSLTTTMLHFSKPLGKKKSRTHPHCCFTSDGAETTEAYNLR